MTIAELLERIGELLERIGLAFERTFNLFSEGKLGDLVLGDLGIIAATGVVGLIAGSILYGVLQMLLDSVTWFEDRRDDD